MKNLFGLLKPLPIPGSKHKLCSMDYNTDLLVVEHVGHTYNYIYTIVDRLIKLVRIIPSLKGYNELIAIDIAQLFLTYIVRLFHVPKLYMIGILDLFHNSGLTFG